MLLDLDRLQLRIKELEQEQAKTEAKEKEIVQVIADNQDFMISLRKALSTKNNSDKKKVAALMVETQERLDRFTLWHSVALNNLREIQEETAQLENLAQNNSVASPPQPAFFIQPPKSVTTKLTISRHRIRKP